MWDLIVSVLDHCLSFYLDLILNEFVKCGKEVLLLPLVKLFKRILK